MEQYLLQDNDRGYYWIWYRDEDGKVNLSGPHPEKMINLPVIRVDNPIGFTPESGPPSLKHTQG